MKPVKGANKQPYSQPLISLIFKFQKWKTATRCSAYSLTTKSWSRRHFFYMNSLRNRGWYPARAHPFSSGNGKGNWNLHSEIWWNCMEDALSTAPHPENAVVIFHLHFFSRDMSHDRPKRWLAHWIHTSAQEKVEKTLLKRHGESGAGRGTFVFGNFFLRFWHPHCTN